MRYFGVVQYKGTDFCGWQKQSVSKLPSIQEEIEKVISKILNTEIKIYGSGRTDAGVHANGQTFHFDFDKEIDDYKFVHGFNGLVNSNICLLSLKKVDDDFHARYNALSKTYVYKIRISKQRNPFYENLVYQLSTPLNIENMRDSSGIFVGKHDFQNFTSKEDDEKNFVRTISKIDFDFDGEILKITLVGDGFMRYMVRMIVGTLVQVGLGKLNKNDVLKLLENNERKPSSYKAPSDGLYLESVTYNE